MPFEIQDFHDLVRLLEAHPEWRAELRRLVLSEELLRLPELVQQLIEAHRRAEERLERLEATVAQLVEAQRKAEERLQHVEERLERLETTVAQLVEAQRKAEERLERLETTVAQLIEAQRKAEERLDRLEATVAQLVEAHRRAEERLDRLEATVAQLIEAQRKAEERLQRAEARLERVEKRLERVEKRLEHVEKRLEHVEIRLDGVEKRLEKTEDRLSKVWGGFLESRYRERAHAYFAPILSRIRVLSSEQLVQLLDEALEAGRLTEADRRDLLLADLVLQGRREEQDMYLVAEISGLISEDDVRRAVDRAQALARATERPVIAAVAGETLPTDVQALAAQRGVWCVTDGHVLSPEP
ncbi:hypothetical protein [Rhodothermus marinus]|uniref:hypothetical protein n=1 Tax=Rhodothermus marinus TaxID=29549 RepID=UPI001374BCF5|nr:hypothetical protein [Rhodothermus marinus]